MALTFAIHDLLCIACECRTAVLREDVELLSLSTKIVHERPQSSCVDGPGILGIVSVKDSVHDFGRFVR